MKGNGRPVFLRHLDANHSFAGPRLRTIFLDLCTFAKGTLSHGQNGRSGFACDRHHPDDGIFFTQRNASHTSRGSSDRPDILFPETNDDPQTRAQQNISCPISDIDTKEPISFSQSQRDNATLSWMAKGRKIRFFDIPLLRGHDHKVIFTKHPNRQCRRHPFALIQGQHIHNGLPFTRPAYIR